MHKPPPNPPPRELESLPESFWRVHHDNSYTLLNAEGFESRGNHDYLALRKFVTKERITEYLKAEKCEHNRPTPFVAVYDNEADARKLEQHLKDQGETNVTVYQIKDSYLKFSTLPIEYPDGGHLQFPGFKPYYQHLVFSLRKAVKYLGLDPELAAEHESTWLSLHGFASEGFVDFDKEAWLKWEEEELEKKIAAMDDDEEPEVVEREGDLLTRA